MRLVLRGNGHVGSKRGNGRVPGRGTSTLIVLSLVFLAATGCFSQTITQTFTASGTFVVPPGVTSITVECWGGGGAGGGNTTGSDGGGGGGGGGYSRSVLAVTPLTSFNYTIGTGGIGTTGAGGSGNTTSFGSPIQVSALGGSGGGTPILGAGGVGGAGAGTLLATGTFKFGGGDGGVGRNNGTGRGGGGGSSAGTAADGTDGGSGQVAGGPGAGGTAPAGGGDGGDGASENQNGNGGSIPGGGGGGSGSNEGAGNRVGGNGADGQITVTYTMAHPRTFYSRQDGNWNDLNTWSFFSHTGVAAPVLPTAADIILIGGQDDVTIPQGYDASAVSVTVSDDGTTSCNLFIGDGTTTNAAATLTLSGDITLNSNGVVRVGGTTNTGTRTSSLSVVNMILNGTSTFTIGNTGNVTNTASISGDLTLNVGTTANVGGNGGSTNNVNLAGNLVNSGTINYTATADVVNFNLTGTGTITGSATTASFYNVNVTGGTRTFGNNSNGRTLNITNDFGISGGAIFQSGNTGGQLHTINLAGNLSNDGTLNLTVNNPTFQLLTFSGAVTRSITGSGTFTLNTLTISKSGANVSVDATSNISISNTLDFSAGTNSLLVVGANSNIVLTSSPVYASISGANSTRYIQLDGATGAASNLMVVSDGTTGRWQFTFPIGSATGGYTPLTIPTISTAPDAGSTLSVKAIYTASQTGQSRRTFRLVVTGNDNGTTFSNAVFNYNDATDISSGDAESDYTTAWRTESSVSVNIASTINTAANTVTITGGSLATATLNTGTYFYYWGSGPPRAWYSYQNGNFSNFNTWTLDPSGTTFDNGLNLFPANGDEIHILNGYTVTVDLSNRTLTSTEIQGGGILDMATSTANNLGSITGTGLLRVGGINLPAGTYTDFVATTGGTIEYYDIGGNLPTGQTTYNKLKMTNSTGSNITYVLVSNMVVNGTFDLSTTGAGTVTWQINDASNTQRTITLNDDLTVAAGGRITVGTGNEGNNATPQHALTMYGNITNDGIIKFFDPTDTEFDEAFYGLSYPIPSTDIHRNIYQGNAVTVTFSGAANKTVTCNNKTDFYRFVLNKGTGQQAILTVNSSNTANFRLFGPSNKLPVNPTGNTWEEYSANALSIINGTLELTGSINIPNLCVGVAANDYFPIPRNGALWLNGDDVTVNLSDLNPQMVNATDGKDGRILMSGLLRISAGTLNGGFSKGLGSQDGGAYLQEGGTVNIWQLRPKAVGTGIFSFTQTGGVMNVGYGFAPSGGVIDQYEVLYARFDLNPAASTFQMSGNAVLNIAKPTSNNATSGLFRVGSSVGNYNVTGGTVNFYTGEKATGVSFAGRINSTVPFYNLNIYEESATTDNAQLQTNSLVVLNNFSINTGNNPTFITSNLDVTVGGNFTINTGTTYQPGTGVTTFNGSGAQAWTHNGTITSLASVVMNKPSGTLTLGGTQTFPDITAALSLLSGTLADGGKVLNLTGTATLTNNAVHTSTGAGVINYASTTATILGSGGTFGNFTLTTSASIATSGPHTITGTLRLLGANSTLDIGPYALSALGNIYSDGTTGVAFTATKRIRTNGFHNAGGLTRQGATGNLLFPVGTGSLYTPCTINVSATTHGTITVRPVASEHPNVVFAGRSVQYYWRVTSSGYSGISTVTHSAYNYSTATEGAPPSGVYRTARFDASGLSWGYTNPGSYAVGTTPPIPTFNTGTGWFNVTGDQLDGEYTCGDITAFGAITPYYSKGNGNWGAATGVWTTNASHSGPDLAGPPCPTCPVIIGDGAGINHTITINANNSSCGTLAINTGSTLDCGTFTGLSFGTNTGGAVSGRGTLRIAINAFPAGDFTNFIGSSGGTVEWYGNSKTIPATGPAPQNLSLATYYNLVVNPNPGNTINLPATNLTIYSNLEEGDKAGYTGTLLTNGSRIISITGNFIVTRGTFNFSSANPSVTTLTVGGNTSVANGATMACVGGGTANVNTLSTTGGITNNGTLNFRNNQVVNVTFTGATDVAFGGTGSGGTTLNLVNVNKGTSQIPTVVFNVGGTVTTTAVAGGWLTISNGTFDWATANTTSLSTNAYTISPTARLRVSAGTLNTTSGDADANDLFLNGALEVAGGSMNVGNTTVNTNNVDIEYGSAGVPALTISAGSLWVKGSVRRSASTISGALAYTQTAGVVTIGGISSTDVDTRGVFEIDANAGSSFTLTGTSQLNILRQTNGTSYADLFLNPLTSNVSATSEIVVGLGTTTTQNNLRINIRPAIGNLTIQNGGGANVQTVNMFSNPLILTGDLTIPVPSVLVTNSLDVTIAGDMDAAGTYTGGTNTTTFNGTGPQSATLSATSTFNDLTISKSVGTTLTLSGTSPSINTLNLLTGILDVGSLSLTVGRNININSAQVGTGSVVVNATNPISNTITSSGGSFTNLTLGGAATTKTVNVSGDLTINGTLNFSVANRYLMIGSNQLIFSQTAGAVLNAGTDRFVRTNGVSSDLGVTKVWPVGAGSFVYPIGTTSNYTPVTYNLNVTGSGTLTVIPVNSAHLTYNQASPERILNYFWTVNRGTTLVASASGTHTYSYPATLFGGSGGTLVAGYLDTSNPTGWITSGHGGTATTTLMTFASTPSTNLPAPGFSYDYSVGTVNTLPNPIQPLYSRRGLVATVGDLAVGGDWTTASNWTTDADGDMDLNNPSLIVPTGVPVVILSGSRINAASNGRRSYRATIDGLLNNGSTTGHNLGILQGTGTFRSATNTFPAGNYTAFVSAAGGTIEYEFAGSVSMNNRSTYNNLSIRSGTAIMTDNDITLNGSLSVASGTTLTNFYNRNISISGNWTSTGGTFVAGSGSVAFVGAGAQSITGATSFYNLILSKPTNNLTLNSAVTVTNVLTLTTGNLITTTANLISLPTAASISGGSASSYISGPVQKAQAGGTTVLYPLGSVVASRYRPATIANTTSATTWRVEYVGGNPTTDGYPNSTMNTTNIRTVSQFEYWNINRISGAATADVTLSYNTGSYVPPNIGTVANLRVARWDGSQWDVPAGGGVHSQSGTNITGTVTVTTVTGFSPFTLASTDLFSPLPVVWLSVSATRVSNDVLVKWKTAQEINNDHFEVERSEDGTSFYAIGQVAGAGDSDVPLSYQFTDEDVSFDQRHYYRIKQVDFDGSYQYSQMVVVHPSAESGREQWVVYPNPFSRERSLAIEATEWNNSPSGIRVVIVSGVGQVVFESGGSIESVNTDLERLNGQLSSGTYMLKVSDGTYTELFRVVRF